MRSKEKTHCNCFDNYICMICEMRPIYFSLTKKEQRIVKTFNRIDVDDIGPEKYMAMMEEYNKITSNGFLRDF